MKVLNNRGLWCYAIGLVALALAYWVTKPGHRWSELGHGAFFAIVVGVLLGVLVWFVLATRNRKVEISLLLLILGAVALLILGSAMHYVIKNPNFGFGWWDTHGFFAWLFLIAGGIACYVLWELTPAAHAQQAVPARQQGTPVQRPYQPI